MKFLIISLLLVYHSSINSDVVRFRNLYIEAPSNEKKALKLIEETQNGSSSLEKGYFGAGKMLMAKYYLNPISKLNTFSAGKQILETAIQSDKNNPELRYLRLTIQTNVPVFLRYSMNVNEDKSFLRSALVNLSDEHLKSLIKTYLNKL